MAPDAPKSNNDLEAVKDWQRIRSQAEAVGIPHETIAALKPKPEWGWRKIDKAIAKLRKEIEHAKEQ